MKILGMMEGVDAVGPTHSFHFKYLSSIIACNGCANADFRLSQFTKASVFCFSFVENPNLLNTLLCFELSPANFQIFITMNPIDNMSQKVLLISLISLFACGAVGIVVFRIKQGNSINVENAQLSPSPVESDWKIWKSSDFGPDCSSLPSCFDPLSYNIGIEFRYPPEFTLLGYRDKGGGLWFSYTKPDNSIDGIAIDCTTTTQSEPMDWLYPRYFEFHSYNLIEKKDIEIGGYQGEEAIFEVHGTTPDVRNRVFKDRIIRFTLTGYDKVCEIQAPLILGRDTLEKMISSFRITASEGVGE